VWQQNPIGGYYDFEATDWLGPPLFAHSRSENIGGTEYKVVNDGAHIHIVGWVSGGVLYWLSNTLLEELTNSQMLAIAKSAQPLH
jgi:polyisoprenyl-teichoic acid--peptidoglycan teichoic acid transferase